MAATRQLAATLLLALAVLASAQVNVKWQVEDELELHHKFPKFQLPPALRNALPTEKGKAPGEQLRAKHRMIYRGTVEFAQVKAVCKALSNKRTVSITATKRKLVETVDVAFATPLCATNRGLAGATPAGDLTILLKKRNQPLERTWTVLRCAAGKGSCYLYRLAPPCFRGRCLLDPDPTLLSSVFSETPQLSDTPSSKEEILGECERFLEIIKDKGPAADQTLSQVTIENEVVTGRAYDETGKPAETAPVIIETVERIYKQAMDPEVTHLSALTIDADQTPQQFEQQKLVPIEFEKIPEPSGDASGFMDASSMLGITPATLLDLPRAVSHKPNIGTVPNQKNCNAPWAVAALKTLEVRAKKAFQDLLDKQRIPVAAKDLVLELSMQQMLDCMNVRCGQRISQIAAVQYAMKVPIFLERDYNSDDSKLYARVGSCKGPDPSKAVPVDDVFKKIKTQAAVAGAMMPNSTGPGLAGEEENFGAILIALIHAFRIGLQIAKVATELKPKSKKCAKLCRGLLQEEVDTRAAEVKGMLNAGGPMTVFLSGNLLQDYKGGAINPKNCCKLESCFNHAAVLIGYDEATKTWELMNTWGDAHGENGYFRISYSDDDEWGPCGMYRTLTSVGDATISFYNK